MLVIARHGETEWNKLKRLQGWKNSPLTVNGRTQANEVAKTIKQLIEPRGFKMISSPLGRAVETSSIIANVLGYNEKVILEPLVKEYSFGEWEGSTNHEVRSQRPNEWNNRQADKWNYVVPGGESYSVLTVRARKWLDELSSDICTVLITHEMMSKAIRGVYFGLSQNEIPKLSHKNNEVYVLSSGYERKFTA
jgi:probable phosphoglycerate mutase